MVRTAEESAGPAQEESTPEAEKMQKNESAPQADQAQVPDSTGEIASTSGVIGIGPASARKSTPHHRPPPLITDPPPFQIEITGFGVNMTCFSVK